MSYFHRPPECGMSTEDLECVGCGAKLRLLRPGQCAFEDDARRRQAKEADEERALYERLRTKYEGEDMSETEMWALGPCGHLHPPSADPAKKGRRTAQCCHKDTTGKVEFQGGYCALCGKAAHATRDDLPVFAGGSK